MEIVDQKRCFLGPIDGTFDPSRDLAVGPWCFKNPEQAKHIQFIEPYERSEVLALHRELYDFVCYVVGVEARKYDTPAAQSRFYLKCLPYYLFLYFFAFSRYRVIKKLLLEYDVHTFSFEKVDKYIAEDFVLQPVSAPFSEQVCADFLEALCPDIVLDRSEKSHSEKINFFPVHIRGGGLFKERFKKAILHFNDFRNVRGVYWPFGIFLSLVRRFSAFLFRRPPRSMAFFPEKMGDFSREIEDFYKIFCLLEKRYMPDILLAPTDDGALDKVPLINTPSELIYRSSSQSYVIEEYIKGKNVICIQHGACYGTVKNHFRREIEYNSSTFTGWGRNVISYRHVNNFRQRPMPYLSQLANSYRPTQRQDWLWMTSVSMKTGDGLEYPYGTLAIEYDQKRNELYDMLDAELKEHVLYKALPSSFHEFEDTLRSRLPREKVMVQGNALALMRDARFLFLDAYSTAFYEAMSMNVPVIMCFMESSPFF